MGFLETTVSLSGTKFKQELLSKAQYWFSKNIKKQDPEWFERQSGVLYEYWKREDVEAACFLINFVDTFAVLNGKKITQRSGTFFVEKFKKLLKLKNKKQFEETYLELQFARSYI